MRVSSESAREAAFADVKFSEGADCSEEIGQQLDSLRSCLQSSDIDLFCQPGEIDNNGHIREKLDRHLAELSSVVDKWVVNSSTSIEVSDLAKLLQSYRRYVGSPEVFLTVKSDAIDRLETGLRELGPLVEKHSPSFAAASRSAEVEHDLNGASFASVETLAPVIEEPLEEEVVELPLAEEPEAEPEDASSVVEEEVIPPSVAEEEPLEEAVAEPVAELIEEPAEEPLSEAEPVAQQVQEDEPQVEGVHVEPETIHLTGESSFQKILREIEPLTEQFRKEYEDLEARLHRLFQEGKMHTATKSDLTEIEKVSFRDAASRVKGLIYAVSEHYQGIEFDVEEELPLLLDFASVPVGFQPEPFKSRDFLRSLDSVAKDLGVSICDPIDGGIDIISSRRVHGRYGSRKRIHIRPHWLLADMNRLSLYVPREFLDGPRHQTMSLPLLERSVIWNHDAKGLAVDFASTGEVTFENSYGKRRREIQIPSLAE